MKKLKNSACLIAFLFLAIFCNAQSYSEWMTDSNNPNLKVRYRVFKDAQNYSYIRLEMTSTSYCSFQVTSSLCNKDANERNGWQQVTIYKDKTVARHFKILNSCTNGFWWWYRNYRKGVTID
jgi:hypothetical protein